MVTKESHHALVVGEAALQRCLLCLAQAHALVGANQGPHNLIDLGHRVTLAPRHAARPANTRG